MTTDEGVIYEMIDGLIDKAYDLSQNYSDEERSYIFGSVCELIKDGFTRSCNCISNWTEGTIDLCNKLGIGVKDAVCERRGDGDDLESYLVLTLSCEGNLPIFEYQMMGELRKEE